MKTGYTYIWEYRVRPERVDAFLEAYGPNGSWARLFRESSGYVRTELYRDRANPLRFVTVDYWDSRESWEEFRAEHAEVFERLDAACEAYTTDEREIGTFELVAGPT